MSGTSDVGGQPVGEREDLREQYDVVVVGGGAAGLAGALTTARALRSTLVVDAGEPRNAPADGVHNYLGREGTGPRELVALGRAEVEAYGGQVVRGTAATAERLEDGGPGAPRFRVRLEDGRSVLARRLLVTTGVEDVLPDLPGLAERWGRDLLHCPFCHGREVADRVVGVLSVNAHGPDQALMWRGWSERVVLLQHTGAAPSAEQAEKLVARGVEVVEGEVAALDVADDALRGVRLADGRAVAVDALVTVSLAVARGGLLADLGVATAELAMGELVLGEHVPADPTGATSVPGVWVAGNVTAPMAPVLTAASAGMTAGSMITKDLVDDDTAVAVAAHRGALGAGRERVPA
ncbi:NAD(P)/FAD-dependent oxidoreductase [uncultured Pseudokineococcus sp.]|uniref:NAD(P)/FAD-dependent oxidoreductase n=1 Tax=uncultured Pseudokineococcus sp. TaxID=1642928 RepID=UPI0026172967|nr:NAD(P)/FAD-dependent oxidoreductase [uncultured Pseudokineococcus sp.]